MVFFGTFCVGELLALTLQAGMKRESKLVSAGLLQVSIQQTFNLPEYALLPA